MTKYQEFLNSIKVISEDLFNEILDSLPEVEINTISFDDYDFSQDSIATSIINSILCDRWEYCFVDEMDSENKIFYLSDVDSEKDLIEIKETFDTWTIGNYNELLENFKKEEYLQQKHKQKHKLLDIICEKATVDQLKNFVKTL